MSHSSFHNLSRVEFYREFIRRLSRTDQSSLPPEHDVRPSDPSHEQQVRKAPLPLVPSSRQRRIRHDLRTPDLVRGQELLHHSPGPLDRGAAKEAGRGCGLALENPVWGGVKKYRLKHDHRISRPGSPALRQEPDPAPDAVLVLFVIF